MTNEISQCRFCDSYGSGKFCNSCGQSFVVKRLTLKGIIHEATHFFTHLDSGFPYTLKRLVVAPGKMQRSYIDGDRSKYQKPFSMFFLCATFAALALYWINSSVVKYFNAGEAQEAAFFHQYWVIMQVCMLPLHALLAFLFFGSARFNYAEAMVLQLYQFSFLFLLLTAIHLLKFIFPHIETRYIELPLIIAYCILTNLNFFKEGSKSMIILKTIFNIGLSFFLSSFVQDLLVKIF